MRIWPSQSTVMKRKVGSTLVDDSEVQPVALGNPAPIMDPRAAERIHSHVHLRAANRIHVDNIGEIVYVRVEKVVPVSSRDVKSLLEGNAFNTLKAGFEKLVRLCLDPVRDVRFRGAAIGRVVFESAVVRGDCARA